MQRRTDYDFIFKILLVGNSGVGKSSVLLRYCGEGFDEQQLSTIGVDFRVKFLNVNSKRVKLAVWDTAGQERFRTLTSSYYKGAQGIALIYDVADRESFDSLKDWLAEVNRYSTQTDAVLLLVANKIDKRSENPATVTKQEGEEFAFEHSMLFIETSAKTCEGIDQAFQEIAYKILEVPSLTRTAGFIGGNSNVTVDNENESRENEGFCGC